MLVAMPRIDSGERHTLEIMGNSLAGPRTENRKLHGLDDCSQQLKSDSGWEAN